MKIILILALMVLTCACSETENSSANEVETQAPSLFDAQLDALDQAGEVEGMLEEATKKRDEEMQKQGI